MAPSDIRVATCNAQKDLDPADARKVVAAAMEHADVVIWQEIETRAHMDAIRNAEGWQTYWPGGLNKTRNPKAVKGSRLRRGAPANAQPISWRKARFTVVHQNKLRLYIGRKGVSFSRYTPHVVLRDRTGARLLTAFQGVHMVAQAWTSRPNLRGLWNASAKKVNKRAATIVKNRGALIGGGDMNRQHWAPADTTGTWAPHGTYGSRFYDTLFFDGLVKMTSRPERIATASDHDTLVASFQRLSSAPTKPPKPAQPLTGAAKVIALAKTQVGYHEGKNGSSWNNHQKYSAAVPGLEWSQNQPWCATFVSWLAHKTGYASAYPKTASCDVAGHWFKQRDQWSEYPSVGAQVFYGTESDLQHTGLVVAFDDDTITTIEGNTNTSGSSQGDGVYQLRHRRRDAWVQGYGHPKFR